MSGSAIQVVYRTPERLDGAIWVERDSGGAFFVMGKVHGTAFIIDGPWDSLEGATLYMNRHCEWAHARNGR